MSSKKKSSKEKSSERRASEAFVRNTVHQNRRKNSCGHMVQMRISKEAIAKVKRGNATRATALKRVGVAILKLNNERKHGHPLVTILPRHV